jgi:hypothetical protein
VLAAATLVACLAPVANRSAPAAARIDDIGPIRRAQLEVALDELVGPEPATLGKRFASRSTGYYELLLPGLSVSIEERDASVSIQFDGDERTSRVLDELLAKRWGPPTQQQQCSLWIDRIHQTQLSHCSRNERGSNVPTLAWESYVTAEQWVGPPGKRLGVEPSRLLGATMFQLADFLGEPQATEWNTPAIGPGIHHSEQVFVEKGDWYHVDHWHTFVNTDPGPVLRLLGAKYGRPTEDIDPGTHLGHKMWRIDGQRIQATFDSRGVLLDVATECAPPRSRSGAEYDACLVKAYGQARTAPANRVESRSSKPSRKGTDDTRSNRRAQLDAALDALLGPEPATLGPRFASRSREIWPAFERATGENRERLAGLGLTIIDRKDGVWIEFNKDGVWLESHGDDDEASRVFEDLLAKRWGPPTTRDGKCSRWIDRVHQQQLSHCTGGTGRELEWTRYLTLEQWVGAPGERFGVEPFRLLGATRAQLEEFLGRPVDQGWYAFPIGPGNHEPYPWHDEINIELDKRGRVDHWNTCVHTTDAAPVLQLLLAKYGRPIEELEPTSTSNGRKRWNVDGQRIQVIWNENREWVDRVWLDVTPAREP